MQRYATIPPVLAPCEPIPFVSENEEMARELMRLLDAIGTPVEEPQNGPSDNDKYETDAPAAEARFVQHLQVCGAPGAEECLVALPAPSAHPSSTPSPHPCTPPSVAPANTCSEEELADLRERLERVLGFPTPSSSTTSSPERRREPGGSSWAFGMHYPRKDVLERFARYRTQTVTVTSAGATTTAGKTKIKAKVPANINKPWSRLSDAVRLHAAASYCEEVGGMAVSLNLHPATAARWTSGTLKTKITRLFQIGLNRRLEKAGITALPYALQFELSPEGRLHLHGAIDTHDRDEATIESIKLALRQAAGRIEGKAAGRQLCLKTITDGAGWASYIRKALKRTTADLGQDVPPIISIPMRRLAGEHHEEARKMRLAA